VRSSIRPGRTGLPAWPSHFNEGAKAAYLLPIQDAGLQTYLRSLDIRFS